MTLQASAFSPSFDAPVESSRPSGRSLASLLNAYSATRSLTEALAGPLSAEDQTVQSMPDTSPAKWHRAHTTWFFETFLLRPHLPGYTEFDPHFNYLFNSYYEAVGERHPRPERGLVTRPGIAEVAAYRRHVDEAMARLFESGAHDGADGLVELGELVELGVNHEQQHQELLLMDIKHVLSGSVHQPAYIERGHQPVTDPGPARWAAFDGGIVDTGLEVDSPGFRFDNEQPRHQVLLQPYRLADRLVTCGEWLQFMADGGYEQPGLWLSDGWHHARSQGWTAPLYWQRSSSDEWTVHTLHGRRPVDPNEPVCHVSFYEADAFAAWAAARLPTEFEWEAAAGQGNTGMGRLLESDHAASTLHPSAAADADAASGGGGLRQLIGDCWEWTGSPYRPYPGYRTPDGAIGEYNGKFMINTMVLRGGCAFTPSDHIRPTYRNFFHPHTRWHLSGVRLATDQ